MTNEEIEAKAAFLADGLNLPQTGELGERAYLADSLRALVSLAYEEAAQKAEARKTQFYASPSHVDPALYVEDKALTIAADIRAMKEPFLAKPVSSS